MIMEALVQLFNQSILLEIFWLKSFVAFSDARIKNIEDTSNSVTDLTTLNAIKITDYTMKDKMMWGDKQYKR